jgi:hypothetical protein
MYPKRESIEQVVLCATINMPVGLWNQPVIVIRKEKPFKTESHSIISNRNVTNGVLYVLIKRFKWKMPSKENNLGFTSHKRFQERNICDIFRNIWSRQYKTDLRVLIFGHRNQSILYH